MRRCSSGHWLPVSYADRLTVTLNCDHTTLEADEAKEVMRQYAVHLEASMGQAEQGSVLLERLVREHTVKRQGAQAFRSSPIGRNVRPASLLRELGEAQPLPARDGRPSL